jgi:hypothetical protein
MYDGDDVTVKSFAGGLCLAVGLALLDSIAAPSAAMCVVFPDLRAVVTSEVAPDNCISACRKTRLVRLAQ